MSTRDWLSVDSISDTNTIALRPSRKKWTIVPLGCGAFVALGIFLILFVHNWLTGLLATGFFGLCGLVAIVNLVRPISFTEITPAGLRFHSLASTYSYDWKDIDHFGVADINGSKMVGIRFQEHRHLAKTRLAKLNAGLCGFHGVLPDIYCMKPVELADMVNEIRGRLSKE